MSEPGFDWSPWRNTMKAEERQARRRAALEAQIAHAQWLCTRGAGDAVGIAIEGQPMLRTRVRRVLARTIEVEHLAWRFERGTGRMRAACGPPPQLVALPEGAP